jgi:hypothetical protein
MTKASKPDALTQILTAYADCHECIGFEDAERDLNFFCELPLKAEQLKGVFQVVTPNGYNNFDADKSSDLLTEVFGDSEYFIAREGSPCVYIRPKSGNIWFRAEELDLMSNCDEFSYDADKKMFRVWWD